MVAHQSRPPVAEYIWAATNGRLWLVQRRFDLIDQPGDGRGDLTEAGGLLLLLARAGGSDALRVPSRLQRAWRDIHAGTQHIFVDERTLIDTARVLLGIAPEGMVI